MLYELAEGTRFQYNMTESEQLKPTFTGRGEEMVKVSVVNTCPLMVIRNKAVQNVSGVFQYKLPVASTVVVLSAYQEVPLSRLYSSKPVLVLKVDDHRSRLVWPPVI